MKNLFAILLCLTLAFSFSAIHAQDVIFFKDGSKENVKVSEVGKSDIKYKKADNPEGPQYVISKRDVLMITYENGSHDVINTEPTKPLTTDFTKNIISFHLFDLIYNSITLSYERILNSGTVGIKIPVTFSFAEDDVYNYTRIFGSGIILNFYPTGQGKWRYFVGPDIQMGLAESSWWDYYDPWGSGYYESGRYMYTRFLVDNGVIFTPVRNMSVSIVVGFGVRYLADGDDYDSGFNADGQFSFNLSYRF